MIKKRRLKIQGQELPSLPPPSSSIPVIGVDLASGPDQTSVIMIAVTSFRDTTLNLRHDSGDTFHVSVEDAQRLTDDGLAEVIRAPDDTLMSENISNAARAVQNLGRAGVSARVASSAFERLSQAAGNLGFQNTPDGRLENSDPTFLLGARIVADSNVSEDTALFINPELGSEVGRVTFDSRD